MISPAVEDLMLPEEDCQICLLHLQNRNLSAVDSTHSALESIENYPSESAKPIAALRFGRLNP